MEQNFSLDYEQKMLLRELTGSPLASIPLILMHFHLNKLKNRSFRYKKYKRGENVNNKL